MMQKSYQRLCKFFAVDCPADITEEKIKKSSTVQKMLEFLCEDLNTPGMWGVLFESLPLLQKNHDELCVVKAFIQKILGLTLVPLPEKEVEVTPEIEKLITERQEARAAKDWKKADELRDALRNLGYEVQDKK
jgi:cysteinyl-tRNA synthetase